MVGDLGHWSWGRLLVLKSIISYDFFAKSGVDTAENKPSKVWLGCLPTDIECVSAAPWVKQRPMFRSCQAQKNGRWNAVLSKSQATQAISSYAFTRL